MYELYPCKLTLGHLSGMAINGVHVFIIIKIISFGDIFFWYKLIGTMIVNQVDRFVQ